MSSTVNAADLREGNIKPALNDYYQWNCFNTDWASLSAVQGSGHIYFLEDNLLHSLSYAMSSFMLLLKFFVYSK